MQMSSFVKQTNKKTKTKGKTQELGKLFLSSLVRKELSRKIHHRINISRRIKAFSVCRPDWTLDNIVLP